MDAAQDECGQTVIETIREARPLAPKHQQPVTVADPESDTIAGRDVAEEFFPAVSDRMGVKADALALVTMLIGLAGAVVFISVSSKPDLWPPPAR